MRIAHALVVAGFLTLSSNLAFAQDLLPVEHGTYVREGTSVDDAPFAAILEYDGTTIAGPHSSACRSTVVSREGNEYRVSTTCDALGDGTPATPYTEEERVVVESARTIRFAHGTDVASYRLAPTL